MSLITGAVCTGEKHLTKVLTRVIPLQAARRTTKQAKRHDQTDDGSKRTSQQGTTNGVEQQTVSSHTKRPNDHPVQSKASGATHDKRCPNYIT
jgi:hypothetical protein